MLTILKTLLQQADASYEPMTKSVLQASFSTNCTCVHMAFTGNALESMVASIVARMFPLLVFILGIKPMIHTDGTILVTQKINDIYTMLERSPRLLIFYVGETPLIGINDTVPMVLVMNQSTNFSIREPISGRVLGQWNSDTGMTLRNIPPWLDYAAKAQLDRLPEIKISLFECPPYVTYKRINLNGTEVIKYDGIEVRIVQEAMRKTNITFLPQDASTWGESSKGPWTRVVEDVAEHRADVAVCSQWLTAQPPRGLEMSAPWTRQTGTFLVPKPWPLSPAMMLYLPLELWTWVLLLNAMLMFVVTLCTVSRLLPSGKGSQYHSIHICFLDTFRILMLNSSPRFPRQDALRHLLTSWAFFSLLTMTIYLTGYTSLLTSPLYSAPIDTVEDMLHERIYWGERSNDFMPLFTDTGNPNLVEFGKRFKSEMSEADREKRILEGRYAVFTKTLSSTFVTETENLSDRARHMLRVMKEPIFSFYVALGLRSNSPLKSHIDRMMTQMQDAGITNYWQSLVIQNLGYHYMNTFFQVYDNTNKQHAPLSLRPVQGAFYLLGAGLALSSITWILEVCIQRKLRHRF